MISRKVHTISLLGKWCMECAIYNYIISIVLQVSSVAKKLLLQIVGQSGMVNHHPKAVVDALDAMGAVFQKNQVYFRKLISAAVAVG